MTVATWGPSGLTGSQTTPLLSLKQTWNTSGQAVGIRLNIARANSATNSFGFGGGRILDLQTNGTTVLEIDYLGAIKNPLQQQVLDISNTFGGGGISICRPDRSGIVALVGNTANSNGYGLVIRDFSASADRVRLYAYNNTSNALAQLNGTSAQTFYVFRTYTDTSNYERVAVQSGAGYFELACETAGTGTDDIDLRLTAAGIGKVTAASSITARSATAIPAGGTAGAGLMVSSTANFGVFFGSGAPTLSAAKGSLYLRSDGSGTGDRAYINTDGSTTWTALTTAA